MLRRGPAHSIILLFLGFFACAVELYAGGAQENGIETAKQYIVDKKYDAALALLAEIIRSDTSRFDEAYALVQEIQRIKGDYNRYQDDLITILTTDPGNYEKALAAINSMNALDPNPSERNKQKIEDLRILAKMTHDRNAKDLLMARALAQIQAKQYMDAIDTYLSGFDMQSDDFLIGTQKADFRAAVLGMVKQIRSATDLYKSENANLMPSLDRFSRDIQSGESGLSRVSQALPVFSRQFLVSINQAVNLEKFAADSAAIRGRSDREYPFALDKRNYNYNEYVRFIQEFMNGPPGKSGQGIAYAARTLIDSEYDDTLSRLNGLYQERKDHVAALVKQGGADDQLPPSFGAVALAGNILLRAHGLKGSVDLGDKPTFDDLADKLAAPYRREPAAILLELHAYRELETSLKRERGLEGLRARSQDGVWQEALAALDQANADYAAWSDESKRAQERGMVDRPRADQARAVFVPTLSRVQDGLLSLAQERFSAIASRQYKAVDAPFRAAAADEKRGLDKLNGNGPDHKRYPEQALEIFVALRQQYLGELKGLDGLDKLIGDSRVEVRQYQPVQESGRQSKALRDEITKALARLEGQIGVATANIDKAKTALSTAAENYAKASQSLSEALGQVNASQGETAKALSAIDNSARLYNQSVDQNKQSAEYYRQSFDIAWDAARKQAADDQAAALARKSAEAYNRLMVEKTRIYIALTEAEYNKENYSSALKYIGVAEQSDLQTDIYKATKEPNPDILYWKNLIRDSMNYNGERFIAETDAQFFVLNNFLNLAQLDFSRATRLGKPGQSDDAKALLSQADANARNVLLVKPNNIDARLLQLKVQQLSDPETFRQRLPGLVDNAVKQEPSNTALITLEILAKLDPGNAKLEQAIYRMKIKLRMIPEPLTAAEQAQIRDQIARARGLAALHTRADNLDAILLLNAVKRRDPLNKEATVLLTRASTQLGQDPDVLNAAEQVVFNRATSLLNSNRPQAALDLVEPFLRRHGDYAPLKRLIDKCKDARGY